MPDSTEDKSLTEIVGLLISEMHSQYVGTRNLAITQLAALGSKAVPSMLAFLNKERNFQIDLLGCAKLLKKLASVHYEYLTRQNPHIHERRYPSDEEIDKFCSNYRLSKGNRDDLREYFKRRKAFIEKWEQEPDFGGSRLTHNEISTCCSVGGVSVDGVLKALGIIADSRSLSPLLELHQLVEANSTEFHTENWDLLSTTISATIEKIRNRNSA